MRLPGDRVKLCLIIKLLYCHCTSNYNISHRTASYMPFLEKNRKTFFDFLSSGLEYNISLFRLRQFGEVGAGLGSPVARVEIGTG